MANNFSSFRIVLLIIFSVNSVICFSQEYIKVKGKVVDQKTNEAVPFVNIYLKDKAIGTNTNSSGEFVFSIPETYKNDSICFASIGYETFKEKVNVIGSKYVVILTPHVYSLNTVEVQIKYYSPKQLFRKVRNRYNKNYKGSPFIADAYYREYIKEDSAFVRANEIAMSIYNNGQADKNYYYPAKIEGVKLSRNYSKNARLIQSDANQLRMLNIYNWTFLIYFDNLRKYDFVVDKKKYFNGRYVYVVKGGKAIDIIFPDTTGSAYEFYVFDETVPGFENNFPSVDAGDTAEERSIDRALINNIVKNKYYSYFEFYIDERDYSIVYFNFSCRIPYKEGEENWLKEMRTSTLFEKHNDTYYPKLMNHYTETVFFGKDKLADKKLYMQMLVNNFKFDDAEPFGKDEVIDDSYKNDYLLNYKYDETFWKNYNFIPDDILRKRVFNDLDSLEKVNSGF